MESKEELENKIVLYKQQLQQVNELIQLDSTNEKFLKLKEDLDKVIDLTVDLLNKQTNESAQISGTRSISDEDDDDDGDYYGNKPIGKTGAIEVGEVVEVSNGERIYAGVVTGIINETEYRIKYYEFDTEVSLPVSSFSRAPPATIDKAHVKIGYKCLCKYAADQTFYDAVVTAITDNGFMVTYTSYGNSEEVPLEYLKSSMTLPKKEAAKKWDGKTLIPIPESLKFLPTDTEEERLRKKKKLKAIKSKNRLISKEVEVAAVQQTWQKFVHKSATKKVIAATTLTGLGKKESMFKSPDVVDGKVGVTNSGKGMTSFAERKKHKFAV